MKKPRNKYHSTFKRFKYTVMLFMFVSTMILGICMIWQHSNNLYNDLAQRREVAFDKVVIDVEEQFAEISTIKNLFPYKGNLRLFLVNDKVDDNSTAEGRKLNGDAASDTMELYQSGKYSDAFSVWSYANDYIISVQDRSGYASKIEPEWYKRYMEDGKTDRIYVDGDHIVITMAATDTKLTHQDLGLFVFKYAVGRFKQDLKIADYDCDMALKLCDDGGDEIFAIGNVDTSCTMEKEIPLANTKMVVEFSKKDEEKVASSIVSYLVISLLLCLAVSWVVSSLCAKFLYQSVRNVFSKMGQTGEPFLKRSGEGYYIDDDESKDVEERLAHLLDKMQAMQLTSLQLQINPHFVFNTLNYVNLKIQKGDEYRSKESWIIMYLSKVLEYAMSEPKYSALIAEEIKMTENYIEIEKIKSDDAFDVIWEIDKQVLDKQCIKLFLQPIIENSINHGIKELESERGRIEIIAALEKDGIRFAVKDNGVGMTPEKLTAVRNMLDEEYSDSSKHIGLRNVNERIKMIYGKEYGVTIESDKNGTEVTIRIGGGYDKVNT